MVYKSEAGAIISDRVSGLSVNIECVVAHLATVVNHYS